MIILALSSLLMLSILSGTAEAGQRHKQLEKATFAGGCFWCTEGEFDKVEGVVSVTPGYTGGRMKSPTYEDVCSGKTGHAEAVEILFDPEKTSFAKLLDAYWHSIDPTAKDRQFCDVGSQYRTAIFYHGEAQKKAAEESIRAIEKQKGIKVLTELVAATEFYPAEDYHRKYYKKNPFRYNIYKEGSGRKQRLEDIWGK